MSNGTTSGLAIAALVLGILGVCMPLFAAYERLHARVRLDPLPRSNPP